MYIRPIRSEQDKWQLICSLLSHMPGHCENLLRSAGISKIINWLSILVKVEESVKTISGVKIQHAIKLICNNSISVTKIRIKYCKTF
jgi:hypothetical protein